MFPSPPKTRSEEVGPTRPPMRRQLPAPIPCPELDRSAISDELFGLSQEEKNNLVELNQIESPSVATTTPGATTVYQQSITGTTTAASICSYDTPQLLSSMYGGTFFAAARTSPTRRSCAVSYAMHHHDAGVGAFTLGVGAASSSTTSSSSHDDDALRQLQALEVASPPMDLHGANAITFASIMEGLQSVVVHPPSPHSHISPRPHLRSSNNHNHTDDGSSLEDGGASIEAPALTAFPSAGSFTAQCPRGRERTMPPSEVPQLFGLDSPRTSTYSQRILLHSEVVHGRPTLLARTSAVPHFPRTNFAPYVVDQLSSNHHHQEQEEQHNHNQDDEEAWLNPEDGLHSPHDNHRHVQPAYPPATHPHPIQQNLHRSNSSNNNSSGVFQQHTGRGAATDTSIATSTSERRSNNSSNSNNRFNENESMHHSGRRGTTSQTSGSCTCGALGRSAVLGSSTRELPLTQIRGGCECVDHLAWRMEPSSPPNPQRSRAAHDAVLEMLASVL